MSGIFYRGQVFLSTFRYFLGVKFFGSPVPPVGLRVEYPPGSVCQWIYVYKSWHISRPYVRVSDPRAPGIMDRLKLRFFWKRVYEQGLSVLNSESAQLLLYMSRIINIDSLAYTPLQKSRQLQKSFFFFGAVIGTGSLLCQFLNHTKIDILIFRITIIKRN